MSGCPARLSFSTAPHLDVQCHHAPGHQGLHETSAVVRTAAEPYDAWSSLRGEERPAHVGSNRVWMTWEQATTGPDLVRDELRKAAGR